jgi:hypothetical protein
MPGLDVRRLVDDDEIPDEFFAVPMRGVPRLLGWVGGAVGVAAGVTLMVGGGSVVVEALGAAMAAVGGLLLLIVVRCGRFTIEVGRRWIRVGAGPFTHRVPRDLIEDLAHGEARGWRRAYAAKELRIRLRVGDRVDRVPTDDPMQIVGLLKGEGLQENVAQSENPRRAGAGDA